MPQFFPILEILLKHTFSYRQQLLFRFFFYLLNRNKTLSFHRCLQFCEEEKVSGCQVRWLRHDYGFVFGQKLSYEHRCVSGCVIIVQNPRLVFREFCTILMNCLAQSAHNSEVVYLIDRTTMWHEFRMHYPIAIEEDSDKNIHI